MGRSLESTLDRIEENSVVRDLESGVGEPPAGGGSRFLESGVERNSENSTPRALESGLIGGDVVGILSSSDGRDTLVPAVATTAPTYTATLAITDGRDILVPAVDTTAPTHTATLAITDGTDTLVAAVSAGAVGAAILVVSDGRDTIVSTATATPPTHTATVVITDGRDTLVAAVSHTAPGNSAAGLAVTDRPDTIVTAVSATAPTTAVVSHTWISAAQGKRTPKASALVLVRFTPTATGLAGIVGFFGGQWNGQFFDVMQYEDKAVIEWYMVPS